MRKDTFESFLFQIYKLTMAFHDLKCHFCNVETAEESEYLQHINVSNIKFTLFPSLFLSTPNILMTNFVYRIFYS